MQAVIGKVHHDTQPARRLLESEGFTATAEVDIFDADLPAAAVLTIQSAYLTAGQRCTCARRLILPADARGDAFLEHLITRLTRLRVGPPSDRPEPFMGPVISAAERLLAAQADLIARGARPLVSAASLQPGTGLLSPGLLDVTAVADCADAELFGPLLQVIRVLDFPAALAEANATRSGLAAGLLEDHRAHYDEFHATGRAGLINWNQQLTGASGAAPFGGIGRSGNHRPSGFFAADYRSHPVASIELPTVTLPATLPPGL